MQSQPARWQLLSIPLLCTCPFFPPLRAEPTTMVRALSRQAKALAVPLKRQTDCRAAMRPERGTHSKWGQRGTRSSYPMAIPTCRAFQNLISKVGLKGGQDRGRAKRGRGEHIAAVCSSTAHGYAEPVPPHPHCRPIRPLLPAGPAVDFAGGLWDRRVWAKSTVQPGGCELRNFERAF